VKRKEEKEKEKQRTGHNIGLSHCGRRKEGKKEGRKVFCGVDHRPTVPPSHRSTVPPSQKHSTTKRLILIHLS